MVIVIDGGGTNKEYCGIFGGLDIVLDYANIMSEKNTSGWRERR